MNPNIWGPDVWIVLHGVSFLAPGNKYVPLMLNCLNDVLPCIFCRESFCDYFKLNEAKELFSKGKGAEYVIYLHDKVDDKLEKQRLEKFISKCKITNPKIIESMNENFRLLSTRPTFDIMKKRFNLRRDYPFSKRNVYMMMMSFLAVLPDHKERISTVLPSIANMMYYLGMSIDNKMFIKIGKQMQKDVKSENASVLMFFKYIYEQQTDSLKNINDAWNNLRNNMHSP